MHNPQRDVSFENRLIKRREPVSRFFNMERKMKRILILGLAIFLAGPVSAQTPPQHSSRIQQLLDLKNKMSCW
jgi:hypothetical protein